MFEDITTYKIEKINQNKSEVIKFEKENNYEDHDFFTTRIKSKKSIFKGTPKECNEFIKTI